MIGRLLTYGTLAVLTIALSACKPPAEPVAQSPAPPAPASTPAPDTATTLQAHTWQLTTATDAQGQTIAALFPAPDRPLGLAFVGGRVHVEGGCNRISGMFTLTGDQIEIGQLASTMMACAPPLDAADKAINTILPGKLTATIEGDAQAPVLRLATVNGNTLTLQGTPTPETRFGGPGTRAFLEVAPDQGPCGEGFPPEQKCLQVRDRFFDDAGLAAGEPGPWRALTTQIEGYTPTDGERQVLRLKRFELADPAGGQPTVHLILDMVVEREHIHD